MRAPKLKTWTTTSPAPMVFDALLGVVQQGKYTILALNNEHRKLAFTRGKTALSWGQEYLAEVIEADGQTQLQIVCGQIDGAPKALMDGWKNGKAAGKLIAEVTAVVEGSASAPVVPTASFATMVDGTTVPWTGPEYPAEA